MYYFTIDNDGKITGYYKEGRANIPEDVIEMSDEQRKLNHTNNYTHYIDEEFVTTPFDFDSALSQGISKIKAWYEDIRTNGPDKGVYSDTLGVKVNGGTVFAEDLQYLIDVQNFERIKVFDNSIVTTNASGDALNETDFIAVRREVIAYTLTNCWQAKESGIASLKALDSSTATQDNIDIIVTNITEE